MYENIFCVQTFIPNLVVFHITLPMENTCRTVYLEVHCQSSHVATAVYIGLPVYSVRAVCRLKEFY